MSDLESAIARLRDFYEVKDDTPCMLSADEARALVDLIDDLREFVERCRCTS